MKRRRWLWIGGLVVALGAVAWYWNKHRRIGLLDAVNPAYWVRRWRGEDLYDPVYHVLMHGNHSLKEVALTIDDGPHTPVGDDILDILKREQVRATFFVVGVKMKEYPNLIRRMLAEGHEVANHTLDHFRLDGLKPEQARREINDNDINFYRITGRHMNLLRPPGVRDNRQVLQIARDLGYETIHYDCAAKDFEDQTPDFIVDRTLSRVENGSIILLHQDEMSTVIALPRILQALKRDGYKFVTVSEMLSHLPKPVVVETNPCGPKNG